MKKELNKRWNDRFIYRTRAPIHYLSGIAIGWFLKSYFVNQNVLDVAGTLYQLILDTITALGGLAVIASFTMAMFTIYKYVKESKHKKG